MRTTRLIPIFILVLAILSGCMSMHHQSLYDRLGGEPALKAVVDDVVTRAAGDARINKKFAMTDIPRLKFNLVKQLCAVTGGPCAPIPRNAEQIHHHLGVTDGEFDAFVEDLTMTLNHLNVGSREQQEVLTTLGGLRNQIVEVHSSVTGTPLPAGFHPAPPLPASQMMEEQLMDKKPPQ